MKNLVIVTLALTSSPVFAGSWNYGCVGNLADSQRIVFNRENMVIASSALLSGNLGQVAQNADTVDTFTARDANSGFAAKMEFGKKWADSEEVVVLVEKASKEISNKSQSMDCGPGRQRDMIRVIYRKKYEVQHTNQQPQTVILDCYENTITACG